MTRHVLITRSARGVGWHSVPAATFAEAVAIARRQHVEANGGEADGVEVKTPILTPVWSAHSGGICAGFRGCAVTSYRSSVPDAVHGKFDFVARNLTGKSIDELKCVVSNPKYQYPYSVLPRGCACEFDAPNVGMSVLLMAHTDWNTEGWVDMLYLRPIGYDYAPWRFGSGSIGDAEWLNHCIAQASELYHKPEYRADWLKHTTYDK